MNQRSYRIRFQIAAMLLVAILFNVSTASAAPSLFLMADIKNETSELQFDLAWFVALCFFGIFAIAMTGLALNRCISAWRGDPKERRELSQQSPFLTPLVLRIVTVALIIDATLILAIIDRLDEGVGSILAGIAGFVLGGISKDRDTSESTQNTNS